MSIRKVSDASWTEEERIEVINAFLERADQALAGPLFEDEDLSDPNGGVQIKVEVMFDKETGHQTGASMVTKVFDDEVYDESIRLLRPFMLGSEEVFLPRVVRQARYLLQTTTKSELDPLVEWIESQLSYDKEFHPVFFKTYISKVDGTGEIAGDNSDIALAYIYGKSVKVDLDKRRYLKGFEDPDVQTIKMSLNAYLKQLMRLVFVVRSEIRGFAKDGKISL